MDRGKSCPANAYAPPFEKLVLHLPLRTSDQYATGQRVAFYQETLNHPTYDGYWGVRSTRARLNEVHVPAFIIGGWYDNYVESDLAAFAELGSTAPRIES